MRGGVVKLRRTRRPRLKPLKPSQKKLLDAVVAGEGIGMHVGSALAPLEEECIDLSGELPSRKPRASAGERS